MANHSSTPFDQGLFLVHLNRGREHFDRRNFIDAAEQLEEARRLRPDDDTVLNLLGLAYFKQEKYKESDAAYRKLIELNPESYTLHFNLGLVCFKMLDLDNAEAIFLRALELKPDNQKTHFYLDNIYEKKSQYYNAIFHIEKPGPTSWSSGCRRKSISSALLTGLPRPRVPARGTRWSRRRAPTIRVHRVLSPRQCPTWTPRVSRSVERELDFMVRRPDTHTLVQDEALAELMQPGAEAGVTLRLEGDGKVLMEKSARG